MSMARSRSPMPSTSGQAGALNLGNMSSKDFKRLLDSQSLVDVTLACDGGQISAHKVVLSACSSYIHKILQNHPVEHPIIILPELNIKDIRVLVNYMYTGELLTMSAPSHSLLKTAAVLNINSLNDFFNETSKSPSSSSSLNTFSPQLSITAAAAAAAANSNSKANTSANNNNNHINKHSKQLLKFNSNKLIMNHLNMNSSSGTSSNSNINNNNKTNNNGNNINQANKIKGLNNNISSSSSNNNNNNNNNKITISDNNIDVKYLNINNLQEFLGTNNYNPLDDDDFDDEEEDEIVEDDDMRNSMMLDENPNHHLDNDMMMLPDHTNNQYDDDATTNGTKNQKAPSLNSSKSRLHLDMQFRCPVCDQDFYTICSFEYHMQRNHFVSSFGCEICDKPFASLRYVLTDHMRRCHGWLAEQEV